MGLDTCRIEWRFFRNIKRLGKGVGNIKAHTSTVLALQVALEGIGVEFIPENGGGAGVRFKKES